MCNTHDGDRLAELEDQRDRLAQALQYVIVEADHGRYAAQGETDTAIMRFARAVLAELEDE
jgi:hypothetical protein